MAFHSSSSAFPVLPTCEKTSTLSPALDDVVLEAIEITRRDFLSRRLAVWEGREEEVDTDTLSEKSWRAYALFGFSKDALFLKP